MAHGNPTRRRCAEPSVRLARRWKRSTQTSGQEKKKPREVTGTKTRAEQSLAHLEGSPVVPPAVGINHPHLEMMLGESRAHPLQGTIEVDSLREADPTTKGDNEPAPAPQDRRRKATRVAAEHHPQEEACRHRIPLTTRAYRVVRRPMRRSEERRVGKECALSYSMSFSYLSWARALRASRKDGHFTDGGCLCTDLSCMKTHHLHHGVQYQVQSRPHFFEFQYLVQ